MSGFDPIKAQREELTGWADWHRKLKLVAMHKEAQIDEATGERDALLGAASLLEDMIKAGAVRLHAMEAEAEAKAKEGKT